LFKKRADIANKKIRSIPRATTKAEAKSIPRATKKASTHLWELKGRLNASKSTPQYKKDRKNRMLRRDM
jgi:hypothetical protein